MPDSDLQISIGVDAGGVSHGVGQAASALQDLAGPLDALRKRLADMTKALQDGLDGVGKLGAAMSGLSGARQLQGVASSARSMGEAIAAAGGHAPRDVSATARSLSGLQTVADFEGPGRAAPVVEGQSNATLPSLPALSPLGRSISPATEATAGPATAAADQSFNVQRDIAQTPASPAPDQAAGGLQSAIDGLRDVAQGVRAAAVQIGARRGSAPAGAAAPQSANAAAPLSTGGAPFTNVAALQAALQQTQHLNAASLDQQRADELAFWQAVLASANLSAAQRAAVEQKLAALQAQTHRQALDQQLGDDRAAADASVGSRLQAIARQTEAAKTAAAAQLALEKTANQDAVTSLKDRLELGRISSAQYYDTLRSLQTEAAQHQVDQIRAGVEAVQAAYSETMQLAGLSLEQRNAALAAVIEAETKAARTTQQVWANAGRRITQDQTEQLKQLKQRFGAVIDPMVSGFTSGLEKMAEGTETFRQFMLRFGQSILDDFIRDVVDKRIEAWLWGEASQTQATAAGSAIRGAYELLSGTRFAAVEATKTAAAASGQTAQTAATGVGVTARAGEENTGFLAKFLAMLGLGLGHHVATETAKTGATAAGASSRVATESVAAAAETTAQKAASVAQITTLAGLAGAGGVASMAAAPFPIDLGAPGFGASMFDAALAFGVASAAGGFDVPAGVHPLTQLHQNEMVLPAFLANPMRDFLGDYRDGRPGPLPGIAPIRGFGRETALLRPSLPSSAALTAGLRGPGSGPGAAGGDTINNHFSPTIHAYQPPTLARMLEEQGSDMIAFMQRAVRDRRLAV